jgi:hypothetical protein
MSTYCVVNVHISKSDRRKGCVAGRPGDAGQTWTDCSEPIQVVGNPMLTFLCLWGSWSWGVEKLVVNRGRVYGAEGDRRL